MHPNTPSELPIAGAVSVTDARPVAACRRSRRQFFATAGNALLAAVLALATVLVLPARAVTAAERGNGVTPEIKLVDDYEAWFLGTVSAPIDVQKMRAEMPSYITDKTVLHEAANLPWGGTTVGYDGWIKLCQISAAVDEKIGPYMTVTQIQNTQHGNIVFREMVMNIKPSPGAATTFVMPVIEKIWVEHGRISRIDSWLQDTLGFHERLLALNALPSPQ